jgi:hypothetical protein
MRGGAAMATQNDEARKMVLAVLQSETVVKMKPFMITTKLKFDPIELAALVGDISADYVRVKFEKASKGTVSGGSVAFYDSVDDAMLFNFTDAFSITLQGLIIHEATHALCDKNKYRMDIGESESMAYIAQCQYGLLKMPVGKRLGDGKMDGIDPLDQVFAKGWTIAENLLKGLEAGNAPLHPMYIQPMRKAVNQHPTYKDKVGIDFAFNGLKRRPI